MTITARSKIQFSTNDLFNDPLFRNKLEKHLPIFRQRATFIGPDKMPSLLMQDNDRGDFRMVLREYGTPLHLHWLIMRLNNIVDVHDWGFLRDGILVMDESDAVLKGLITLHYTNKK